MILAIQRGIGNFCCSFLLLLMCCVHQHATAQAPAKIPAEQTPVTARAHWLSADLIAWDVPGNARVFIQALPVTKDGYTMPSDTRKLEAAGKIDGALAAANPHLRGMPLWRIVGASDADIRAWLKGHVQVIAMDDDGRLTGKSMLQIGGILDDLYANDEQLGARFSGGAVKISLWAPTAKQVYLHLFDDAQSGSKAAYKMTQDPRSGIWKLNGQPDWNRKYYLYVVDVYVPELGRIASNVVTDPYSLNLSVNSKLSQIINLDDADLKPAGWDGMARDLPGAPEDRVLYELHVRDFSVDDYAVPASDRGRFAAFSAQDSGGMRHLTALAGAGLSDVHLLPTYDCATIPEKAADQLSPPDLTKMGADGAMQQAAIGKIRERDGFNWCYDPLHYMAPEGSYSSNPNDTSRVLQFRSMVKGLSDAGLGTVLDVVFNHTMASGQDRLSVLDRIVPGYYHRLDENGSVARSTCCANTATERRMMEKLMLDTLQIWARDYKVSGFRFDLMGHHSRDSILKAKQQLAGLSLSADGVDGRDIYLYGEGWNFGEVANDARFMQATQRNMGADTGVGTFSDRIRDAIRGGGVGDKAGDITARQGFASGLFTAPNAQSKADGDTRKSALAAADHIRAVMAGSISDYEMIAADGKRQKASALSYNGSPVSYVSDPQEVINYAEAHDNQTLFDSNAYKLPLNTSRDDRVRWQNIANSIVLLSQGVPFLHAGQELLRSKSLDRNSYNSGDWFNRLDFTMTHNGWGRGLPHYDDNKDDWPIARTLLTDKRFLMGKAQISRASDHVKEMLQVRKSSPLFRMQTADEIMANVRFDNSGPDQIPGLIVMRLGAQEQSEMIVVINATRDRQSAPAPINVQYQLHDSLRKSSDRVVRTATWRDGNFIIPPLTTAIFVKQP
jgi:pullulanase